MINYEKDTPELILSNLQLDYFHRYHHFPVGSTNYIYTCKLHLVKDAYQWIVFLKERFPNFNPDGCSSSFDYSLSGICCTHDFFYYLIRNYKRDAKFKKQSDIWFRDAILIFGEKIGGNCIWYSWLANSRYLAVRLFGNSHLRD